MAGNIVIRFTGDASGLAQFYAGVAGQTDAFVRRLQKTYSGQFKDVLGLSTQKVPALDFGGSPIFKNGKQVFTQVGSAVRNLKVEADQLNNVLRVTGETGFKLANGTFLPVGSIDLIRGNVVEMNKLNAEFAQLRAEADALQRSHGGALTAAQRTARNTEGSIVGPAAAAKRAADQKKADALLARDTLTNEIKNRRKGLGPDGSRIVDASKLRGAARDAYDTKTNKLIADRVLVQKELEVSTRAATRAQRDFDNAAADPRIAAAQAEVKRLRAEYAALGRELGTRIGANRQALRNNLENPNVDAPAGYQQLQSLRATKLIGQLHKAGLSQSAQGMYTQEAEFHRAVTDLETGITRVSGAWKNNQGVMQSWTAQLDQNGNTITKFTGHMSGINKILDQTVRNFQKVIEWTVATTLVFGTLAAAGQGLEIIKNIDANLTRLGVTASLTAPQVKKLYTGLLEVANLTATPLEELVKAADDLALAVKRPGETTQQLTADILTLGTAIGIYTNLTGEDTVTATDELVAVMKQLGYTATQVYGILNKVTAAAGGQSGAISDITKGLSVMAEAGKQAHLSVDQQIGVIKTLSQVTSKSPAEIATAFKNLVGALENPAAIKALKSYNIGLISEGNSIIDVYSQIADKIRTGVIPANAVSGLLRAISGGPRRAPDAAALLANMNQVLRETATSANATNEAFLANAKVVDTLQAKFVILQNILKDKIFVQFGQVFKDTLTGVLNIITPLAAAFGGISPKTLSAIVAVAGLGIAIRLVQKALRALNLFGIFKPLVIGSGEAAAAQLELSYAIAKTNQQLEAQGILAKTQRLAGTGLGAIGGGKGLRSGLLGGAIGAAAGAASGGGLSQIAGGGLQGLGIGLLAIPEPTLITKVAGAIALLGGTFLSLQEDASKTPDTLEENAQAILSTYQAAKQAGDILTDLKKDQANVQSQISGLEATPVDSRTADDQSVLNDLYNQYAQNILSAANAQVQLNQATIDFAKAVEQLPNAKGLADELQKAVLQGITGSDLTSLLKQAQINLLKQTSPNIVDYSKSPIGAREIGTTVLPATTSYTQAISPNPAAKGRGGENVPKTIVTDINDHIDSGALKSFFKAGEDGSQKFVAQLQLTEESINDINNSIANANLGEEFSKAFNDFAKGKDAIKDATDNVAVFEQVAQNTRYLGFLEAADQIDKVKDAASQLSTSDAFRIFGPEKFADINNQLRGMVELLATTGKALPKEAVADIAETVATYQEKLQGVNVTAEEHQALVDTIAKTIDSNWVSGLKHVGEALEELSPEVQKLQGEIQDAINGVLGDVASKSSEAFSQLLNGDISPKKYAAITAELNNMAGAAKKVGDSLQNAITNGGDNFANTLNDALTTLAPKLAKIPGLEDAATLSAGQLITRLFTLADTYNLNSRQIDKLGGRISDLFKALSRLSNTPYKIYIGADISGLKAALVQMRNALSHISPNYTGGPTGLSIATNQANELEQAIRDLGTVSSFTGGGGGGIGSIYRAGGTGSGATHHSGGSKKKKSTPTKPSFDVSTLDLPDEIAVAPNRAALIQEAIRRARALQKKIPGASKEAKNDIVELLKGTQRILEVRGVKEEYLRKALEELTAVEKKRLEFETKADLIRRIRVGNGSFAAIANVPVNSRTGVSLGGPTGPINITLNLNGTVLTPSQFAAFADMIGASIRRQLSK